MITVQKRAIETLGRFLIATDLNFTEARIRDQFLRDISPFEEALVSDRNKIYETYCEKDENGAPKIEDSKYTFPGSAAKDLTKDLDVLLEETIELKPPDKLKQFLEGTNYKPKPGEVELIDSIISQL